MKSKLLITIALILAVCTISIIHCHKERDVIISDKVKLPEENSELLDVIVKGDTLNFIYKSGSTKPKFNAGDIVVGKKGSGYLKKVNSTTTKGDTLILFTTQACLTDAIQKGSIDTTFSLSPQSQQMSPINIDTSFIGKDGKHYFYKATSGTPHLAPQGELFNIKIPNVSIEIRDPNNNLAVSVSIDTIKISKSIDIDLNLQIDDWEITDFRLVGTSSDGIEFKGVNMNFVKSISEEAEIQLLPPIYLGSITIFIGPVPVVFVFELGVYGGAEATLTVNLSQEIANEVNVTSTNTIGAEYFEGSWQPIWDNTLNGNADWSFSPLGSISATVKDFFKGSLECKIYGVLGPSLYLKPYLYDEISYPPFDFKVGGGIAAGLAFKVEILGWELAEFDYTFVDYTKLFYHSTNNPPNIPSIPSGPASGSVNTPYDFSSSTTDPEGENIAIRFDWGDGNISNWSSYVPSGQTVTMSHSWSSAGTYYVKHRQRIFRVQLLTGRVVIKL